MNSYFNEENTVEQMVLDTLCANPPAKTVAEESADYMASHLTLQATAQRDELKHVAIHLITIKTLNIEF